MIDSKLSVNFHPGHKDELVFTGIFLEKSSNKNTIPLGLLFRQKKKLKAICWKTGACQTAEVLGADSGFDKLKGT